MTTKHAKYSPSKLPRIIRCPGSVKLSEHIEEETSVYAAEGTMLHDIMEKLLKRKEYTVSDTIIKEYSLDKEQTAAVNDNLDYIFTLLAKQTSEYYEGIEVKVSLEDFAGILDCSELTEVYGIVDYLLRVPAERTIYVLDHKFGKGIEVFPDSEQLKTYAIAALKNIKVMANFDKVVIIVAQPRLYNGELFKVMEFTPTELLDWCTNDLVPALKLINADTPVYYPCDKACQWCRAKTECKARHTQAQKTAQDVFKVYADIPDTVDLNEMIELIEKAKDLEKYIKDINLFLINRLKDGKSVPGRKLVAGRSIRVWKDPDEIKTYLLDELDIEWEDIHTSKFKSPAQVEKIIGRPAAKEQEFKNMIHKPEGKPTMVAESDKRKAIEYQSAEQKFAQFVEK